MAKCPICKTGATAADYRPFCSKRCADIDLHRWMAGHYAVPAVDPPDDFDTEIEQASRPPEDTGEDIDEDAGEDADENAGKLH